jgi:hypothetical protein
MRHSDDGDMQRERLRRKPNRWRGRWVLVVTVIILALNVAQLIMAWYYHVI